MVDVILEVRDARCAISTQHPDLDLWAQKKPRILVMNRADMISGADRAAWQAYFDRQQIPVFWTTGNTGQGINGVKRACRKVCQEERACNRILILILTMVSVPIHHPRPPSTVIDNR